MKRRITNNGSFAAAIAAIALLATTVSEAAVLHPGHNLTAGQALPSSSGRYHAVMQHDGNLVVYRNDGAAIWATWTQGSGAVTANMQADGNFVLYTGNGHPVWSTGTHGRDSIFTVDDWGRAMVLKVKKWDASGNVEVLLRKGAKRSWVAPQWDAPPPRGRPGTPHCIGDPKVCGGIAQGRYLGRDFKTPLP
ncbi:hypothetical protein L2Y96_04710 [Luteibacter aegosomaticola]|uniref:hypothetical protein n=1 Tax=Luteibacter aegosomaticola TaxID=2911538 RepID=UPI001FF87BCD|nr:hypothetical protein [Luteibacter aegosomaticola]UPG91087.1 hypothetical protein L2Y96_04710 [Luteibacter aegosomaticola]